MKEKVRIPLIHNFNPTDQSAARRGEFPLHSDEGAWRPLTRDDHPHPGHILGIITTKKDMIPVRLYGPGNKEKPSSNACPGQVFETSNLQPVQEDIRTNL